MQRCTLVALIVACLVIAVSGEADQESRTSSSPPWAFTTFLGRKQWRLEVFKDRPAPAEDNEGGATYEVFNGTVDILQSPIYDDVSLGNVKLSNYPGQTLSLKVEASSATQGRLMLSTGDQPAAYGDDAAADDFESMESQTIFDLSYALNIEAGHLHAFGTGTYLGTTSASKGGRFTFSIYSVHSFSITLIDAEKNDMTTWLFSVPEVRPPPTFFQQWGMPILMIFIFMMLRKGGA